MIRTVPHTPAPARSGLTLTEVLMAMLILGLGVVSVFTLFPISIVRSIQATQGTNAKILENEVTEQVRSAPLIINVHTPPSGAPAGPRFRGFWEPNRQYRIGDIIVPTIKSGGALPSPHVWFVCTATFDNMGMAAASARSGLTEPNWLLTGQPINDLNNLTGERVVWRALPFIQLNASQIPHDDPANPDSALPAFLTDRYVVDPLGWAIANDGVFGFGRSWQFGNDRGMPPTVNMNDPFGLLRINGGLNSETLAALSTVLPDSWEQTLEDTPLMVTDADPSMNIEGQVTFSPAVDLTGLGGTGGLVRVVLTSLDGRVTAVRNLTSINPGARTVNWSAREPLPARFPRSGDPVVGFARIEIFDRRYTWFMTVKKTAADNADIKVVVVFKRGFAAEEEQIYDANFANPVIDLDMDGTEDGAQHPGLVLPAGARTDWVKITWDATPGADPTPLAKAGNYLFDARDCEWYRIREVFAEDLTTTPAYRVLILDRSVVTRTPDDNMGMPPANAMPPGRVILMRGIVDIFDL